MYIIIGCLIIIGFLGYKLTKKQQLDKQALADYQVQFKQLQNDIVRKWDEFDSVSRELIEASANLTQAREATEYEK